MSRAELRRRPRSPTRITGDVVWRRPATRCSGTGIGRSTSDHVPDWPHLARSSCADWCCTRARHRRPAGSAEATANSPIHLCPSRRASGVISGARSASDRGTRTRRVSGRSGAVEREGSANWSRWLVPQAARADTQCVPKELTPQEKKVLSYQRDRRNTYGENDKSSRKNIPRSKALGQRSFRSRVGQILRSRDVEAIDDAVASARRRAFDKTPDQSLGDHLDRADGATSELQAEAQRRSRRRG